MFHPLMRLLASRPELLAEHLVAYVPLVAAQAGEAAAQWRRQALLVAVQLLSAALAVGLAGVAALLAAALPLATMPAPWALIAVPLLPVLIALGCGWALRRNGDTVAFAVLREQLAADAALLRETGDAA